MAKAYPPEAQLASWIRTINTDRNKGITVTDDYQMKQRPMSQSFMTTCAVNTDNTGQLIFEESNGRKVLLQYDAKQWRATKEKLSLTQPEDKKFSATWEGRDIWRVLLINISLSQKGKFSYYISK